MKHVNDYPPLAALKTQQRELSSRRSQVKKALAELSKKPDKNRAVLAVLEDPDAPIDGPHSPVRSSEIATKRNEEEVLTKAIQSLADDIEKEERKAREIIGEQFRPDRKKMIAEVAKHMRAISKITEKSEKQNEEMRKAGLAQISWPLAAFSPAHMNHLDPNSTVMAWFSEMESKGWL